MTPDEIMKSEQATTKTFRLSKRLSVEMTIGPSGWTCEWSPEVPQYHLLTRKERRAYKQARKEMFTRLSAMLGGTVAVFDYTPDGGLVLGDVIKKEV